MKRNLSTILASFKDQSDERRPVNRVEEGRRERKLVVRNGQAGGGSRGRSRPGTGGLAKQLSSALDDWGMDGVAGDGEGTSDLFKRIDDKMTMLDDYKRGRYNA